MLKCQNFIDIKNLLDKAKGYFYDLESFSTHRYSTNLGWGEMRVLCQETEGIFPASVFC